MWDSLQPHGLYSPWNSPGQNTGVGSLSLLQGLSPTQSLNLGLPHCRQLLYQLSHKGSPRKLEWVAYLFFPIQEPNQGLLNFRRILYQLSYQGSLYSYSQWHAGQLRAIWSRLGLIQGDSKCPSSFWEHRAASSVLFSRPHLQMATWAMSTVHWSKKATWTNLGKGRGIYSVF